MECQRCSTGKEAKYRVYTDVINMKVCAACAEEARKLGIAVEVLDGRKEKNNPKATPNLRIAGWILGFIATNDEAPYRELE